jgi:hypothetical protein
MPLSEFLSRVEAIDGEVRVYQHNHTGTFYSLGEGLGDQIIRYDAGEDTITTVERDTLNEDHLF